MLSYEDIILNPVDPRAVAVLVDGQKVGCLPSYAAKNLPLPAGTSETVRYPTARPPRSEAAGQGLRVARRWRPGMGTYQGESAGPHVPGADQQLAYREVSNGPHSPAGRRRKGAAIRTGHGRRRPLPRAH